MEIPTPLMAISDPLFDRYRVKVWVKRDDLNHPHIQGNKWHKLKFNLDAAKLQRKTTLLTFGGAYSNHIAATAYAAKEAGLKSIGLIRGEELAASPHTWSHTLKQAVDNGMALEFLTRQVYRLRDDPDFLLDLQQRYPDAYLLPEGGSNELAIQGFESLMTEIEQQCPQWDTLFTPVGTGATFAGLVRYALARANRKINGVAVLKQADYLLPSIRKWIGIPPAVAWQMLTDYHAGGYGKITPELQQLKQRFEAQFSIPLDPVYSIKMVAAFYDQLQRGEIPPHSKVILLHTGGLQGNALQQGTDSTTL